MLLAYQKAQIINTRFSFILVCSVLLFCRELCTELPGCMKQNECGDVIMSCQQEQVWRSSVQPLSVSCLGWVWRCSVCPQAPLRSAAGLHHQSASEWARHFHGGLLGTKGKGKYKAFLCERLGLAICHRFSSFPFFSCSILMEELNSCVFFGESPRVFQAAHFFF